MCTVTPSLWVTSIFRPTPDGDYMMMIDGDPGMFELLPGGPDHLLLRAHIPHWEGLIHIAHRARQIFNLDAEVRVAVEHLRSDPLLKRLGGGCQVPIAAYARVANGQLQLDGVITSIDGKQVYRYSAQSDLQNAEGLGIRVAESLLGQGAQEVLGVSG